MVILIMLAVMSKNATRPVVIFLGRKQKTSTGPSCLLYARQKSAKPKRKTTHAMVITVNIYVKIIQKLVDKNYFKSFNYLCIISFSLIMYKSMT